jgi:hypothetical protein
MEVEMARGGHRLERSRGRVTRLASLFAVDAFAGGFVVTVFIVFWFERTFGASLELMSAVFFVAGLLQAGSSIAAASVGARFGLLNTMVFTHLPSNILLIMVPLMPTLSLAIVVLLARFALSQMDVPTRQAYIAAMVDPEERTAAAATTNTARYVARPFGPLVGTALMRVALGAPWVVAGSLKSVYDLVLWRMFKKVELPSCSTRSGAGSSRRSIRRMHPVSSSIHRRMVGAPSRRRPSTSATMAGRPVSSVRSTRPSAASRYTKCRGSIADRTHPGSRSVHEPSNTICTGSLPIAYAMALIGGLGRSIKDRSSSHEGRSVTPHPSG